MTHTAGEHDDDELTTRGWERAVSDTGKECSVHGHPHDSGGRCLQRPRNNNKSTQHRARRRCTRGNGGCNTRPRRREDRLRHGDETVERQWSVRDVAVGYEKSDERRLLGHAWLLSVLVLRSTLPSLNCETAPTQQHHTATAATKANNRPVHVLSSISLLLRRGAWW